MLRSLSFMDINTALNLRRCSSQFLFLMNTLYIICTLVTIKLIFYFCPTNLADLVTCKVDLRSDHHGFFMHYRK